jgi:hypothetical protein
MTTSALGLVSKSAGAAVSMYGSTDNVPGYYRVIYDKRFQESVTFATYMEKRGLDSYGLLQGDITPFWYRQLEPLWKQAALPLMGMTAKGPLFCLEQLAAQYGMRVIFRAEHKIDGGKITHTMAGVESMLQRCNEQHFSGNNHWSAGFAELMLSCSPGNMGTGSVVMETSAPVTQEQSAETLVSWIIAPAHNRRHA